jgi:hypothetical protein
VIHGDLLKQMIAHDHRARELTGAAQDPSLGPA